MSPAASPVQTLVKRWKAMGASSGAKAVLAFGPQGPDLARAAQTVLNPEALTLLHSDRAPPRARFETTPQSIPDLAEERPGAFDLILAGGALDSGDLFHVRGRLHAIVDLLADGGVLAAEIRTFCANGPGGDFDALLFPHLARSGELSDDRPGLCPLTAASWSLLLGAAGLNLEKLDGIGQQTLPPDLASLHMARLAAYDPVELTTGALRLIARKRGAA